jgi:outer membrane murein-binding lipoprotein Lpp
MPNSDSDETASPFRRKEVEKAARFLAHPLTQLIDRGLVWIAIILGALTLAGGKTYFHGLVEEGPVIHRINLQQNELQSALRNLAVVQTEAAKERQALSTDVRLLVQRIDQQEKRVDRIERLIEKP